MTFSAEYEDTQLILWVKKSEELLIKKLSRNDCLWAEGREFGHQNGVYIPREVREQRFFPDLKNENTGKPQILKPPSSPFGPKRGKQDGQILSTIRTRAQKCISLASRNFYFRALHPHR